MTEISSFKKPDPKTEAPLPIKIFRGEKPRKTSGAIWSDFKSLASLVKIKGEGWAREAWDSLKTFDAKEIEREWIDELKKKNKALLEHRLTHLGDLPAGCYKEVAESNKKSLKRLESMIEADISFLTAVKIIRPTVKDPHLKLLLDLQAFGNKEGPQDLLERAKKLEESIGPFDGAWPLAAELYETAFDLEKEINALTPGEKAKARWEVRNDLYKRIAPLFAEKVSEMKKEDPEEFLKHFPAGEVPREKFLEWVNEAIDENSERIEKLTALKLKRLALEKIDSKVAAGALKESAAEAWERYDRMMDPLSKWGRLSDEGYDVIADEVKRLVATMPLSLGMGAIVRAGASVALSAPVRAGLPVLVARGAAFAGGALATGVTMETLDSKLDGRDFDPKNALHNGAMDLAFHGSGRAWGKLAERLGFTNKAALEAGSLATATLTAAAATYADPVDSRTLSERLTDSGLALASFHLGHKLLFAFSGKALERLEAWGSHSLKKASMASSYDIIKPISSPVKKAGDEKTARIIDVGTKETSVHSEETKKRILLAPEKGSPLFPKHPLPKGDPTKVGRPSGTSTLKKGASPAPFEKEILPLTRTLDVFEVNAIIAAKGRTSPEFRYEVDPEAHSVKVETKSWEATRPLFEELSALKAKGKILTIDLPDPTLLKSSGKAEGSVTVKSGPSERKVNLLWTLCSGEPKAASKIHELNARILGGDLGALNEAGAYYVVENESIGGNAGDSRFAINGYVDPTSGKIVAVGNVQNIPREIVERSSKVSFLIKFPSFKEIEASRGETTFPIEDVILDRKLTDPSVIAGLKGLKGISYAAPPLMEKMMKRRFDGRRASP